MGVALPATHADILHRLEIKARARFAGELAAQPRDHHVGGHLALREGLERNEHLAGVALAAPCEADDVLDSRVLAHDVHKIVQLLLHGLKGNALVSLDETAQPARILLREESLRDVDVEIDVQADRSGQQQHHEQAVSQGPGKRAPVAVVHFSECVLAQAREASRLFRGWFPAQQPRRHHRRGGEREHQRDHDGNRQRDRELAEQPPDDATHEQDGNEHGNQRQAHRQYGEADFTRTPQRCFHRRRAFLDPAPDIFQHDDRIVDDEAGCHRQRHERQIVQAVSRQIHGAERAEQRDRHRDRRDQGRGYLAQEQENDHDDQCNRDHQGAFHFNHGCADRRCAVDDDVQIDRTGD